MPRMTNAKSAPVLNSADEFERKLNWQLFVAEQEALLVYDPDAEWNVGEPIVDFMPSESVYLGAGDYAVTNDSAGTFRPMIELILYDGVDTALKPDCEDCDVLWDGNEPCFVCGGPRREAWVEPMVVGLEGFASQVATPWDGLIAVAPYSPSEALRMVGAAMGESFQEVAQASERAARAMRPVMRQALENERGERRVLPEQVRGVQADYVLFDEVMMESFYEPPSNLRLLWANANGRIDHGLVAWSNYPTPEQARLVDQARSQLANELDVPVEFFSPTPGPYFADQVETINRMSVEPASGTVDVETVGFNIVEDITITEEDGVFTIRRTELLPPPLGPRAPISTAQNPQNTRRRPRITPDTNRSYPTSEPNWHRRRPRRA